MGSPLRSIIDGCVPCGTDIMSDFPVLIPQDPTLMMTVVGSHLSRVDEMPNYPVPEHSNLSDNPRRAIGRSNGS